VGQLAQALGPLLELEQSRHRTLWRRSPVSIGCFSSTVLLRRFSKLDQWSYSSFVRLPQKRRSVLPKALLL
jgi:hypothetical protein